VSSSSPDVVIVGAGPAGVTAATLLGAAGVPCLVLDRWTGVYPQPRAVHLDDEVNRLLDRMGVAAAFAELSRPAHGLRLVDSRHQVLAEFWRDPQPGRHGYPSANMFDQPELEAVLRTNLERFPSVTLRGDVEVVSLTLSSAGVQVAFEDRTTGESQTVQARYVLGCDGANSLVRRTIGARMEGLGFEQRWLVVDVDTDAELDAWPGVHQVCDPQRAATYMRVGERRHRWEFRLSPGEDAVELAEPEALWPLLRPWTREIPVSQLSIVRSAEYTFRAQVADRWRAGTVFLLGDAAHLTPPFIGQGLCAGMRDAQNLAWKLAAVLHRELPEAILDSYEQERKPHARALIRTAVLVGRVMTEGGDAGNALRRVLAPALPRVPLLSRRLLDSASPRLQASSLVRRTPSSPLLPGALCPNAVVTEGRRFDDLYPGCFVLVTTAAVPPALTDQLGRRGVPVLRVAPRSALGRWLARGLSSYALVRPDATVMASGRDLSRLPVSALPSAAAPRPTEASSPAAL
jgi:3-(3-hydroxy-phenyl)propionate hydroxylase